MQRRLTLMIAGVPAALIALTAGAMANEYDNPSAGDVPCIVVKDYDLEQRRDDRQIFYAAETEIENICGRAMEVSVCFPFLGETEDGETSDCQMLSLRPYAEARIAQAEVPVQIATPVMQWRYLPY